MKVNTSGDAALAMQSDLASQLGDAKELGKENGVISKVATSGANAAPDTGAVTVTGRKLDPGPIVDEKGSYKPRVYEHRVVHNNEGGHTKMVREDR